jgi:hypothetical protein
VKLIQCEMMAKTDAAIDAFGKNKRVKKVFWALFVAMAGLVLARVLDPVTGREGVGLLRGWGEKNPSMNFGQIFSHGYT